MCEHVITLEFLHKVVLLGHIFTSKNKLRKCEIGFQNYTHSLSWEIFHSQGRMLKCDILEAVSVYSEVSHLKWRRLKFWFHQT